MNRVLLFVLALLVSLSTWGTAQGQNGSLYQRTAQQSSTPSNGTDQSVNNGTTAGGAIPNGSIPLQSGLNSVPLQLQSSGSVLPPGLPPGALTPVPEGLHHAFTFIPPTQSRAIRLHDIVTVRVDEASTSLMLGNATSRKTASLDAVLSNWVRLVGIDTIKPAPQRDGDPRVTGSSNEVYRGDSQIRTSDSLIFNIATQVVDIKPNGLLTLQGSKKIAMNDNQVQVYLIGTCRSVDIDPNNTLLSRNLLDLEIKRDDNGHVRDGYSRGWLTKLYAKFKPF